MNKKQVELLKKIISEHMNIIMSLTTGMTNEGGKPPSDSILEKLGLPKEIKDLITDSYKYGKLGVIESKSLEKMSETEVDKLINNLRLTPAQKRAVEFSQINTQVHLDSLQSRITSTVVSLAVQEQKTMYETVKKIVPKAMADNTPRYKVIQQLRETSQDWERDWHRVAHTEMWNAKCNGEAQSIASGESPLSSKGDETRVYKLPAPNACNMCKKLYLEPGGTKPIVWKLSDLMANGTNYGLKQADWKAVVGTIHPNCMCPLSILPDGYHLNDDGSIQPD